MKPITLSKSEINREFHYEMWNGTIGTKELNEDEFLSVIDNAISNGYFITITEDTLATTIHEHSKNGEDIFEGYQDPDHFDSATTIKSIGEILDKAKDISDRNLSDEVCDMNTVDLPVIKSQLHAIMFEQLVNDFCAKHGLCQEEWVCQQDVVNLIGE